MALPNSRGDREHQKFVEDASGDVAVRVVAEDALPVSGGSAGGGNNGYTAKPSGTNADATSAYASATTLTVTGLPYTLTQYDIASIQQIPTSGSTTTFSSPSDFSVSGTTITVTGAAFAATDEFLVNLTGPDKGYSKASDSSRTEEIDPLSTHHVEETLVDETNITTNTTTYAYFDMDGYRNFSLQGETSGATPTDVLTVTVEASNQDDGTAPASCAYQDVTNALFGVASWVDTDFFGVADTSLAFKYVRVKYVTSNGAGNDADLVVYSKRIY